MRKLFCTNKFIVNQLLSTLSRMYKSIYPRGLEYPIIRYPAVSIGKKSITYFKDSIFQIPRPVEFYEHIRSFRKIKTPSSGR